MGINIILTIVSLLLGFLIGILLSESKKKKLLNSNNMKINDYDRLLEQLNNIENEKNKNIQNINDLEKEKAILEERIKNSEII